MCRYSIVANFNILIRYSYRFLSYKNKKYISKLDEIVAITLAFLIITIAMIPGYNITKKLSESVYPQSLGTETSNKNTSINIIDINMMNLNSTKTYVTDSRNLVPNQYIVILKENATFTPQLFNNTITSLNEEWNDFGLIITSFSEDGMLTIDLNQTQAQEGREVGIASDATVADALTKIQSNPNVDYVQPNQIFGIE